MRKNVLVVALLEAGMLGLVAALGYLLHQPLVFASLGPTAYEVIETPGRPSARFYNIVVGHGIGVGSAVLALALTHAWWVPAISLHGVPPERIASIAVAGLLTVLGTLILRATQPAAVSTTLLVASGIMQSGRAIGCISFSVFLFALLSVPLRRWHGPGED